MKRFLDEDFNRNYIQGVYNATPEDQLNMSWWKLHSYLKVFGLTFLKFFYLILVISGLAGVVTSILKVLALSSISDVDMILIFGMACISLSCMSAGAYGFHKMEIEGKGPGFFMKKSDSGVK